MGEPSVDKKGECPDPSLSGKPPLPEPETSDRTLGETGKEEPRAAAAGQPESVRPVVLGELATAYVPWQMFMRSLDLREALALGTLFPELVRTPPLYKFPAG